MNGSDIKLLDGFLERLVRQMACAGCNDFEIPATEENIELYVAAYDGEAPRIVNGGILCDDFMILQELQRRLGR